ncbi:MAG: DMT family transporter [Burkholderiales bacterium]|nr:MAG: DMT family transporter [Burkholderiales bacterium]
MRPAHIAQLLLLSLLWGGAYLFMRSAAPAFGAMPMIFLRMLLGSLLVLVPLTLWRGGFATIRRRWVEIAVFGLAFTALPFAGLGWAALSISAGMLAVLQSSAPIFAALVAAVWLHERITPMRAVGLVIGLAGVVLLVWDKVGVRESAGLAILVTIAVTVLWGVSSNYARVKLAGIDALSLTTGSIGISALALAPFAWAAWPAQDPGPRAWAEVAFLGVASSGFGFLLYFRLLRAIGAVRATSVTFLNPVVAMASAWLYLGEPVTARMVAGCAVILAGTALTLGLVPWPRRRETGPARDRG